MVSWSGTREGITEGISYALVCLSDVMGIETFLTRIMRSRDWGVVASVLATVGRQQPENL